MLIEFASLMKSLIVIHSSWAQPQYTPGITPRTSLQRRQTPVSNILPGEQDREHLPLALPTMMYSTANWDLTFLAPPHLQPRSCSIFIHFVGTFASFCLFFPLMLPAHLFHNFCFPSLPLSPHLYLFPDHLSFNQFVFQSLFAWLPHAFPLCLIFPLSHLPLPPPPSHRCCQIHKTCLCSSVLTSLWTSFYLRKKSEAYHF